MAGHMEYKQGKPVWVPEFSWEHELHYASIAIGEAKMEMDRAREAWRTSVKHLEFLMEQFAAQHASRTRRRKVGRRSTHGGSKR